MPFLTMGVVVISEMEMETEIKIEMEKEMEIVTVWPALQYRRRMNE